LILLSKESESRGLLQRKAFQDASKKLRKYFADGGQPGMEYLSFVRSLDPYQFNLTTL